MAPSVDFEEYQFYSELQKNYKTNRNKKNDKT